MNEDLISFEDIVDLDIDNMKKLKYNVIKKRTLQVLKKFTKHIEMDEFDKAEEMLSESPGGDDMGCDNMFITFGRRCADEELDLGDMIDRMKRCK